MAGHPDRRPDGRIARPVERLARRSHRRDAVAGGSRVAPPAPTTDQARRRRGVRVPQGRSATVCRRSPIWSTATDARRRRWPTSRWSTTSASPSARTSPTPRRSSTRIVQRVESRPSGAESRSAARRRHWRRAPTADLTVAERLADDSAVRQHVAAAATQIELVARRDRCASGDRGRGVARPSSKQIDAERDVSCFAAAGRRSTDG